MVQTGASDAISYLEKLFEARNSHVRALTSKGTVLDTIAFRSEEKEDTEVNAEIPVCLSVFTTGELA